MSRDVMHAGEALEVETLASEIARAYRQMAAFYRDKLELTGPDADARARGIRDTPEEAAADLERIRDRPPDQVSWFDLTRLIERDPDEMEAMWHRLKGTARRELSSGHRTADALEWQGRPWDRVRFLAIRESFQDDDTPSSGIESALIDSAAEGFSDYLAWTEHLNRMVSLDMEHEKERAERDGRWRPMRLSYAEAVDQAARMAERAHTRFLRTVKMLQEVRRFAPAVYVGHAGQINVGAQQVNVATDRPPHGENG
jgi:hypothetical protein